MEESPNYINTINGKNLYKINKYYRVKISQRGSRYYLLILKLNDVKSMFVEYREYDVSNNDEIFEFSDEEYLFSIHVHNFNIITINSINDNKIYQTFID